MQTQIPINKLRFGHEASAIVNVRVVGRKDGIDTLAANIHARGLIEPLIVKRDGDFFAVSDGNRRLAALHTIHGVDSDELVDCKVRDVDDAGAFEDSLTAAVLAHQLHPVDQYEAFAKLDAGGKTHEEIARHFGMSEKEVRQALSLGRLSPKIRGAWRDGDMNADAAKAFTLAVDPKQQEKVFAKLQKSGGLHSWTIRNELGVKNDAELSNLLNFVGAGRYRDAGGQVIEDLFGDYHQVSDGALLKQLANDLLSKLCEELLAAGWSWAATVGDLPKGAQYSWPVKHIAEKDRVYLDGEKERLAFLRKRYEQNEEADDSDYDLGDQLNQEMTAIEKAVMARSFNESQKKKLGCIVDIEDGNLSIQFGVSRPAETMQEKREQIAGAAAGGVGAVSAPKSPTTISNAMSDRLETQLLKATVKALKAEAPLTPLFSTLIGIVASQIHPDRPNNIPHSVSKSLADVRAFISADIMNKAVAEAFESKDYFGGAPKPVLLKAIGEAINADESRKLADKTKAEIGKWALANLPRTGWLPKELRTPHYAGPGSAGFKKPVKSAAPAAAKPAAKKAAKKKVAKKTKKR